MDGSTIENFKRSLVERRNRIESNQNREKELKQAMEDSSAQAEIVDMAQALEQLDRDTSLAEQERREIAAINLALSRIENGNFGICEDCEEGIPERRLQALPAARFCADCQEAFEEETRLRVARPATGMAA